MGITVAGTDAHEKKLGDRMVRYYMHKAKRVFAARVATTRPFVKADVANESERCKRFAV